MKNTTRTALRLLIATPLAASALALGAGVAQADDHQGFSLQADVVHPDPKPQGPGDIAIPTPGDDPKPQGPGDITNPEPGDDPKPDGPDDITNPEPGDDPKPDGPDDITDGDGGNDEPGPQIPGDKTGPNPGDEPQDVPGDAPVDVPADQGAKAPTGKAGDRGENAGVAHSDDVRVPTRIDAGFAPAADDQGMDLMWVLAGGGAITAAGSLLARRRLAANR